MATGSDYFLSLDNKSKQRYKVKINNIQGYDPYQITKEKLSGYTSKFPPVTYPDIVYYFLFSFIPLTKEELKAYKSLDSYNQFVSGWVKEVKQNCLKKLPWLLDGSVPSFYCSILIRCPAGLILKNKGMRGIIKKGNKVQ